MSTENSNIQKKTVDATRQILMNELGLSREFIREQTKQIVETPVKQHLDQLLSGGVLEKIVRNEFNEVLYKGKKSYADHSSVATIVSGAIHARAMELVKSRLLIKLDVLTPEVPHAITNGD